MDNYKTIEQKLQTLTPFHGNSLSAYWNGGAYYVESYTTVIARASGDKREVSSTKYSVTTSRQQNLIRRAWGVN